MRIAITGGTGFVGSHLARALVAKGHQVLIIARDANRLDPGLRLHPGVAVATPSLTDEDGLARAFEGCDGVAHCAGINREIGLQTYQRVHVQGTQCVVGAARRAGVKRIALISFLRARPACGSPYHESKWAAEVIVRGSGLEYTVIKPGVIYGRGDHMLDHLSHALHTFPVFGLVGIRDKPVRPVAVDDVARVLEAALVEGRLPCRTVFVLGPEELTLEEAVRRVGRVLGKRPLYVKLPVAFHYLLARGFELVMRVPLVSRAQVRILSEGLVEPAPPCEALPEDLLPARRFTPDRIREGLPPPGGFGLADCRSSS